MSTFRLSRSCLVATVFLAACAISPVSASESGGAGGGEVGAPVRLIPAARGVSAEEITTLQRRIRINETRLVEARAAAEKAKAKLAKESKAISEAMQARRPASTYALEEAEDERERAQGRVSRLEREIERQKKQLADLIK